MLITDQDTDKEPCNAIVSLQETERLETSS